MVHKAYINHSRIYNNLKGMRAIKRLITTFIILCILLTGCGSVNVDKTKEYDGERLRVGIIGNIPEIREKQVVFEEIDFDFLKKDDFDSRYNAIFISKENLSEAAKAEYAAIYKRVKIPFYFIETEKSYVPFVKEELDYEDGPDYDNGMYITGILNIGEKYRVTGYGLYNDTKNKRNIKCVYSRVFQQISEIKNNILS
jgi:hypothetical protein